MRPWAFGGNRSSRCLLLSRELSSGPASPALPSLPPPPSLPAHPLPPESNLRTRGNGFKFYLSVGLRFTCVSRAAGGQPRVCPSHCEPSFLCQRNFFPKKINRHLILVRRNIIIATQLSYANVCHTILIHSILLVEIARSTQQEYRWEKYTIFIFERV